MLYGAAEDDGTTTPTKDDEIVREAVERYTSVKDWQAVEDERSREDRKFANGDDRNTWQWPEKYYNDRTGAYRPCLTVNNTRVHNDLIINAISKQGYGITVRPTGGKSSYQSARVMQSVIRRIEYVSKASTQYRKVIEHQVDGGIGYILIKTDYVSEKTFDQDIFLEAALDPNGVYLDPWVKQPDGSDARFGIVFERMPRKEFNRKYPEYKNKVGRAPLDNSADFVEWLSDKAVILAKYFRKIGTKDTLVAYVDGESGEWIEKLASEIKKEAGDEIYKALREQIKEGTINGKTRSVQNDKVEWFLIAGNTIIDRGDWAGKYIPICRCVGRETVVDGTLDRKGHTRPLISAQQMLNYNASTAVEVGALQPKSPFMAAARAIEGQEQWKTANVDNFAVLVYNDIDDEAPEGLQQVNPPIRLDPPKVGAVNLQGMQDAERQMMMISGQFQAQMGENDTQSAASGKAINERQQQGDTATWHFNEHFSDMLRYLGTQMLDLIPKIYDTKRTLHVMDEDGERRWIVIDPDQTDAVTELKDIQKEDEAVKFALNPNVGEYECVSDPGPDFASQRQEQWDAIVKILSQNMELVNVIGDLLFRAGDFMGSDKIAERLEKEIKALKPYLFSDKASPEMQGLNEQLSRLTALNSELMQKLALKEIALKGKDERRDVDAFKAETDRMKAQIDALAKLALTPQQRAQMEHEMMMASRDDVFNLISQANQGTIDAQSQESSQGHERDMQAAQQQHEMLTTLGQREHERGMAKEAVKAKPKASEKP